MNRPLNNPVNNQNEDLTFDDNFMQMLDDVFNQMAENSTDELLCVDEIHTILHNDSFKIIQNYVHEHVALKLKDSQLLGTQSK